MKRDPPCRFVLFNKPYGVLSQFTDSQNRPTLADYLPIPAVYPAGRLDLDSEGLLLLTGQGPLQARISHPRHKLSKTYWVQVEGIPIADSLARLRHGVELRDGVTAPAEVQRIDQPKRVWSRNPPIRYRATIPTCWLELSIREGRNRQVRRMTAAVGHPTLRLIRYRIGPWTLDDLAPGQWRTLPSDEAYSLLEGRKRRQFETPASVDADSHVSLIRNMN
ncbi:MAG: pseudouridine synthase [Candidatus Competibacteraceae bacterium]|nr:pseudouridine synthase [Candidatus Competibacteraceae bacterium]